MPPASGSTTFFDNEVTGFLLGVHVATRTNPAGVKAFGMNYWVQGAERRHTIGKHPAWTALAARNEAKELRRPIDRGGDPSEEKREAREAAAVSDLAERYRTKHLPRKAETSRKTDWAIIKREVLPVLARRKVADVHHGDIVGLHRAITDSGRPVRANRVVSVISKMFSLSL
jgi:hypothetical protein